MLLYHVSSEYRHNTRLVGRDQSCMSECAIDKPISYFCRHVKLFTPPSIPKFTDTKKVIDKIDELSKSSRLKR